jgi:hypothetical protein
MVLAPQVGPPAYARPQLWRSQTIRTVITIQANNTPILDMRNQQTATTAIVSRAAHPNAGDRRGDFLHNRFHATSVFNHAPVAK